LSIELATTKTSALNPKVKALTLAAAGVSLSKHTMHRTHDRSAETPDRERTIWVAKPYAASTRDVFGTPRSPWEPRLYGCLTGVSNLKIPDVFQRLKRLKRRVKPIVLLSRRRLSGIYI
jgi:hypothetical protein